jgi:hypothetical protein
MKLKNPLEIQKFECIIRNKMKIFWLDMKNILIYNIGEQVLKQAICLDGCTHPYSYEKWG